MAITWQEIIDTRDATATSGDLLENTTAYVNNEKITGNIPKITSISSEGSLGDYAFLSVPFMFDPEKSRVINCSDGVHVIGGNGEYKNSHYVLKYGGSNNKWEKLEDIPTYKLTENCDFYCCTALNDDSSLYIFPNNYILTDQPQSSIEQYIDNLYYIKYSVATGAYTRLKLTSNYSTAYYNCAFTDTLYYINGVFVINDIIYMILADTSGFRTAYIFSENDIINEKTKLLSNISQYCTNKRELASVNNLLRFYSALYLKTNNVSMYHIYYFDATNSKYYYSFIELPIDVNCTNLNSDNILTNSISKSKNYSSITSIFSNPLINNGNILVFNDNFRELNNTTLGYLYSDCEFNNVFYYDGIDGKNLYSINNNLIWGNNSSLEKKPLSDILLSQLKYQIQIPKTGYYSNHSSIELNNELLSKEIIPNNETQYLNPGSINLTTRILPSLSPKRVDTIYCDSYNNSNTCFTCEDKLIYLVDGESYRIPLLIDLTGIDNNFSFNDVKCRYVTFKYLSKVFSVYTSYGSVSLATTSSSSCPVVINRIFYLDGSSILILYSYYTKEDFSAFSSIYLRLITISSTGKITVSSALSIGNATNVIGSGTSYYTTELCLFPLKNETNSITEIGITRLRNKYTSDDINSERILYWNDVRRTTSNGSLALNSTAWTSLANVKPSTTYGFCEVYHTRNGGCTFVSQSTSSNLSIKLYEKFGGRADYAARTIEKSYGAEILGRLEDGNFVTCNRINIKNFQEDAEHIFIEHYNAIDKNFVLIAKLYIDGKSIYSDDYIMLKNNILYSTISGKAYQIVDINNKYEIYYIGQFNNNYVRSYKSSSYDGNEKIYTKESVKPNGIYSNLFYGIGEEIIDPDVIGIDDGYPVIDNENSADM